MSMCVGCHFDPCRCFKANPDIVVIVTRAQADEALGKGDLPYQHLKKRFKEEHGLDFEIREFYDRERFKWYIEKADRAFKIVYKPRELIRTSCL